MEGGGHHPLTHIYPNLLPQPPIPRKFVPLHTAFDVTRLPPIPRILDLQLSLAARNVGHGITTFPNVMELALLGDTVLKTIIVEKLQELTQCGRAGSVADLSQRLNQNVTFSYLCLAYQLLEIKPSLGQKAYADVFEAYFGALWRESNDLGKAHIRMVVRGIFSPEVFPIIAEWKAGRRHFEQVGSLNATKRTLKFAAKQRKDVSKAIEAIRASHPVKVGGRSREHSVVFPRGLASGMPPILSKNGVTKAKRLPIWQIKRAAGIAKRNSGLNPTPKRRITDVIDLTLDEDEVDDDDDDDIICLDDEPAVVLSRRINGISPNAEAGPSRIPEVFIDVNPSLPQEVVAAEPSGVLQKRKREDTLQHGKDSAPESHPIDVDGNIGVADEIDDIFTTGPPQSSPPHSCALQTRASDNVTSSGDVRSPPSAKRAHRASSDMILTPLTIHPIRIAKPHLSDRPSRAHIASPLAPSQTALQIDSLSPLDASPTVMTRSRRKLDETVQAAISEMGLGDDADVGPKRMLDQNMEAAIAEMGLGVDAGDALGDETVLVRMNGVEDHPVENSGEQIQSDNESDLGLQILFDPPVFPTTALPVDSAISPSGSDMILTPITTRNPFSPRSVPDWIAHFSPAPAPPPIPSTPLFTALRLGAPIGPSSDLKAKPARSPLRMLGDVFGSVRSRVEAAFRKTEVKGRFKETETKAQKKARRKRMYDEAQQRKEVAKEDQDISERNSQNEIGEGKPDAEAIAE